MSAIALTIKDQAGYSLSLQPMNPDDPQVVVTMQHRPEMSAAVIQGTVTIPLDELIMAVKALDLWRPKT